jgi:hypothetical protein
MYSLIIAKPFEHVQKSQYFLKFDRPQKDIYRLTQSLTKPLPGTGMMLTTYYKQTIKGSLTRDFRVYNFPK